VQLDGSESTSPNGATLTYAWSWAGGSATGVNPTASFPLGTTIVTLTVDDGYGSPLDETQRSDEVSIEVLDTTPPVITCPADITIECDESTEPSNTGKPTATDYCDPNPTIDHSDVVTPGDCANEETITRTWAATDASGNSNSCDQIIDVVDTTPPDIECNAPDTIIPPDAPISFTATATDNCDDDPSVEITEYDCYTYTKKGKRIDKTESCVVGIQGDTITILDSGGVGDHISWTVLATDNCDNETEEECEVEVVKQDKP
jgi:hypothetical protein